MIYTGYGLLIGAAMGLLTGALLSIAPWIASVIGAGLGLVVGSVVDAWRAKDDQVRRSSGSRTKPNAARHVYVTPCIRNAVHSIGMSTPRSRATRWAIS